MSRPSSSRTTTQQSRTNPSTPTAPTPTPPPPTPAPTRPTELVAEKPIRYIYTESSIRGDVMYPVPVGVTHLVRQNLIDMTRDSLAEKVRTLATKDAPFKPDLSNATVYYSLFRPLNQDGNVINNESRQLNFPTSEHIPKDVNIVVAFAPPDKQDFKTSMPLKYLVKGATATAASQSLIAEELQEKLGNAEKQLKDTEKQLKDKGKGKGVGRSQQLQHDLDEAGTQSQRLQGEVNTNDEETNSDRMIMFEKAIRQQLARTTETLGEEIRLLKEDNRLLKKENLRLKEKVASLENRVIELEGFDYDHNKLDQIRRRAVLDEARNALMVLFGFSPENTTWLEFASSRQPASIVKETAYKNHRAWRLIRADDLGALFHMGVGGMVRFDGIKAANTFSFNEMRGAVQDTPGQNFRVLRLFLDTLEPADFPLVQL
ncbi:hypothetical protein DACRYDRAFT_113556 [Dacryopinax primogenitus]|uniref:Uncharacterized protein n=1 Tax=Dacryopinax primogenitus (strain DJM 731) TaxID=1858805 RepID=M5G5A3_DACPD|nr:uncharacterized protein DACRYDRAFT_113556 [Dacryopinax primogenitus]EJU05436.1 hypothetical protein DACRYDRAFT_113556 [Dacryopinax primogenitus]